MMIRRAHRHAPALPMLAAVTLLVSACGEAVCTLPPCNQPPAIIISVTSSVTGDSIPGAFVQQDSVATQEPCNSGPGTTCYIYGGVGTYAFTVGAPGYQAVHRTVAVPAGKCTCSQAQTQHLDVALAPTP